MKLFHVVGVLICFALVRPEAALSADDQVPTAGPHLIVVIGAAGNPQYEISFYQWSERWHAAAKKANVSSTIIGRHRGPRSGEMTDYEQLRTAIKQAESESKAELWIVLIGHGTFDRRIAKFNLDGPDVSADELATWLQPVTRPIAIVNCASASGPFIPILSAPNRIVVAGTKSGTEVNFARFGDYLSQAIDDPLADLDKDHQTSLWEAFLTASRRTIEYYDSDGRIATEHALLDDNGDKKGVRADQYRGLVAVANPTDGNPLDGRRAHQWHLIPSGADATIPLEIRNQRNELEFSVVQLQDRKDLISRKDYLDELERLLIQLAELNEKLDQRPTVQPAVENSSKSSK